MPSGAGWLYTWLLLLVNRHFSLDTEVPRRQSDGMDIDKSDLLELLDAALSADYTRVRRAGAKIAERVRGGDPEAASQLKTLIRKKGVPLRASGYSEVLPIDSKSRLALVEEQAWPDVPLFVDKHVGQVFGSFLEDVRNVDLLIENGVLTRLALLLSGPPGTGKTLLAGHIAAQLGLPLYAVRLDSVISSLLGDTAKNIRSIFDYVSVNPGILFIDEMDAVAKLRSDQHELGELKRVVNTLIQGLDSLDDRAIVIGATNHAELLDPAIWRRFPYKIELDYPNLEVREDIWTHYLAAGTEVRECANILAKISEGLTGSDIQNLALAARRQALFDSREPDWANIAWAAFRSRSGRFIIPERAGLTTEQKRQLANELVAGGTATASEVGRLLGVSRQAVSLYLKDSKRGD